MHFYKSALGLFFLKTISMGSGFFLLSFMAKVVSNHDLNGYMAALAWAGIIATPFNGVINQYLINLSSKGPPPYDRFLLNKFSIISAYLISYLLLVVLIGNVLGYEVSLNFAVAAYILALFFQTFFSVALLIDGKTVLSQVGVSVIRPVMLMILLIVLHYLNSVDYVFLIYVAAVSCLISAIFMASVSGMLGVFHKSKLRLGRLNNYFTYFGNVSLASLYAQAPVLIVSLYSLDNVASYSIAMKVVGLVTVVGSIIGIASAKQFADKAGLNDIFTARSLFVDTLPLTIFISIVVVFLWFFWGREFIDIFFGSSYVEKVYLLVLYLMPSQIIFLIANPLMTYFYGAGESRFIFQLQVLSSLVVVFGTVLLLEVSDILYVPLAIVIGSFVLYFSVLIKFFKRTRGEK